MPPYIARPEVLEDHDSNHSFEGIVYPRRHPLSPTQARTDTLLSTYSSPSNSTICLVNPEHGKRATVDRSVSIGSPFFWNFPLDTAERQRKPETGITNFFTNPWRGWRVIIFGSWVNILLALIPISLILPFVMPTSLGLVFVICALAMIPLVKLHDLATCELALRIGGTKTGLLNASMSNIVELVIAISALRKCELRVVQLSLIGSMLSKLLLILGMCFFAGGMRFSEQGFDASATQIHSSLLSISVGALLLPAAYHFSIARGGHSSATEQNRNILHMSHGVSVILLCIYASYLLFQLWSHKHLYQDPLTQSNKHGVKFPKDPFRGGKQTDTIGMCAPVRLLPPYSPYRTTIKQQASSSEVTLTNSDAGSDADSVADKSSGGAVPAPAVNSTVKLVCLQNTDLVRGIPMSRGESSGSGASYFFRGASDRSLQNGKVEQSQQKRQTYAEGSVTERLDEKLPQLSWPMTLLLLIIVTVLVAAIADCLVGSMDGVSPTIRKEWVGLILLPAASSIAECVTAVNVSVKDQLTLSISVAVGSTIQTALFVIPFMITLAWVMEKPLALLFDPFECVVLYISVQTMTNVVGDAKSSWLHGVILLCLYVIIAVAFWFYPVSHFSSTLAACTVS